jgi:hypothetical protein
VVQQSVDTPAALGGGGRLETTNLSINIYLMNDPKFKWNYFIIANIIKLGHHP